MYYVRKMSFISYFQHLVVVRKREREQRSRRMILADDIPHSSTVEKMPGPVSP